ncbi:MAG: hypothetical protein A2X08_06650 [Bacteroidetes bacterium GWA2_32_17]|nr:MAG: hypothetical protein A2X08_06650 [Bacteroidetes bacterium GWA2_32_17]
MKTLYILIIAFVMIVVNYNITIAQNNEEISFWDKNINLIPPFQPQNHTKGVYDPVVHYIQFALPWGPLPIGNCSQTIEDKGCAITCVAMILATFGANSNPGQLNTWLTNNNGYINGCDIVWGSVDNYPPQLVSFNDFTNFYSLNTVRQYIDDGNMVIAKILNHNVLIAGYDNDGNTESDYIVYDPIIYSTTHWDYYDYLNCSKLYFYNVGISYPKADFVANQTTIFAGQSITFTDLSISTPTSWYWDLDGSTIMTSTLQNPTVTYNQPGTYSVSLLTTNAFGRDVETKPNYITVLPMSASFTATPTILTIGSSVNFTDNSLGTPTSWNWSFPGGTPSNSSLQNPTIVYNTAGTFDVSLTVTNTGGSSTETKTNYINVGQSVGAYFTYSINQSTKTVYFTDISTNGPNTWFWDFGDGATSSVQSPTHTYSSYNIYTVTLTAGNQYSNTSVTKNINITHPDLTISGNVVEDVIGLSEILVQAIDDDGYTTATTISGANGAFELSVPYQWSGTIFAVATGYSSVPVSYSNLLYNVNGLLLNLTHVTLTINKTQLYGTYYKFEVVGAPTFGTVYDWTFSGPGLYDNYTTSLWWTNEFFVCSPDYPINYSVTVIVHTELGETFSASLPIPINQCVNVTSATTYVNGCSSYRLGDWITFRDISQPFSEISRVVVWYSDGTTEVWDTKHCSGFTDCLWPFTASNNSFPGYQDIPIFQYAANCYRFQHHFASPGVYSASLTASNLSGTPSNPYDFGFIIVNCDAVSTNFSNVVSYTNSGIYNFYSGKFDLSTLSYISDYNNKNINLYACNEIVLEPGVTIEPNPGYTVTLQIDPCLQSNGTKSYKEDDNNETPNYSENVKDNNSFIESINPYSNDVKLYPNPNNGRFAVETTNPDIFSMQLYSPIGTLIKSFDNIGKSLYLIDITNYAFGVYYLKVNTDSEVKIFKVSYSLAQ